MIIIFRNYVWRGFFYLNVREIIYFIVANEKRSLFICDWKFHIHEAENTTFAIEVPFLSQTKFFLISEMPTADLYDVFSYIETVCIHIFETRLNVCAIIERDCRHQKSI